jgi:4-hydroxy-4-methyl-2-oxoglutarate aldolase
VQKPVVITEWERPAADLVSRLEEFGVSTIHEAQGRTGLLAPYMRPIYAGARTAGSAVTVSLPPGDNLMIHVAVEVCKPGDILIVVPTSFSTDGYFGELLATSLIARGVTGLVIEAGCRDVRSLTEIKFPVWSRAISSQGTVKASVGSVNIPVVCADARICPGDVIVCDDDGIVVVQRQQAAEVAKASEQRITKENATRERLLKGESGLDIYGWRQKLAALGLEYRRSKDVKTDVKGGDA